MPCWVDCGLWPSPRTAATTGVLVVVLTACSTQQPGPSTAPSSFARPLSPTVSGHPSPSPTTATPAFRVGDEVPVGEVVALMLGALENKTVRISVSGARPLVCDSSSSDDAWSFPSPVAGVREVRIIEQTAYVREGSAGRAEWTVVDLTDDARTLETRAAAEGLNRSLELLRTDSRWNERISAMDPAATVRVDAVTSDGFTLTVPTDPESQWAKDSGSERKYVPASWVLGRDGAPRHYRAPDGSRVFTFRVVTDAIEAPSAEGAQSG